MAGKGFGFQVLPKSKSRQRFLAPGRPSGRKVLAHLFSALNIDAVAAGDVWLLIDRDGRAFAAMESVGASIGGYAG